MAGISSIINQGIIKDSELHAVAQSKPITAIQLKERLDAFFESNDDFILNLPIVKGISAAILSDKAR